MMRESENIRNDDDGRRRWFADEYFDLIVWLDTGEAVSGFQLCYDKQGMERALTWRKESGFIHERVDAGETDPAKNRSPILLPDGLFPAQDVTRLFETRSAGVDQTIRAFVMEKLREYGRKG
jgi:hypothetical protein